MIEVRVIDDAKDWDSYMLESGGHPLQLWGWGEVKRRHNWEVLRLEAYEGKKIVSRAQLLIRKLPAFFGSFAYIPRGQSEESATLEAFAGYVRVHHTATLLSIEPDVLKFSPPKDWKRSRNRILPAETIRLDLTRSEEELLADMAKKTRQYIRKSAKDDVRIVRVARREELNQCLGIYRQTADRAQFDLHDSDYYQDVYDQLGEHSPIFVAYKGDMMIAFLWLATSKATAFELYGGMTNEGQLLRANYTLKWHAIQWAREEGIHYYDFGGLIGDGVSNFKRGWTTEDTVFAGTFDRPLSPLYPIWSLGLPLGKKTVRTIKKLLK